MRVLLIIALLAGSVAFTESRVIADGCGCDVPRAISSSCPNVKVHVHYVPTKVHRWCGPPAPIGPVLNTEAFRRVPPPAGRTRVRFEREIQQEVGELKEFKEKQCGADVAKLIEVFKEARQASGEQVQVETNRKTLEKVIESLEKLTEKVEELAQQK